MTARRPTAQEMDAADYRKSTYSGGGGNECVERSEELVAGWVCVRDSKNPDGPKLAYLPGPWMDFLAAVVAGELTPVAAS